MGGVAKGPGAAEGRGWCSNEACREAEKKENEEKQQAAKRQQQIERRGQGAGRRGPRPSEDVLVEQEAKRLRKEERKEKDAARQARKEERKEKDAGERGPCPGEGAGGRPMDTKEVRAEKEEIRLGLAFFGENDFEDVKASYEEFLGKWGRFGLSKAFGRMRHADAREALLPLQDHAEDSLQELPGEEDQVRTATAAARSSTASRPQFFGEAAARDGEGESGAD